jgi:hypothetical protein
MFSYYTSAYAISEAEGQAVEHLNESKRVSVKVITFHICSLNSLNVKSL